MSDDFKEICHHIWLTGWAEFLPLVTFFNDHHQRTLSKMQMSHKHICWVYLIFWYAQDNPGCTGIPSAQMHQEHSGIFCAHGSAFMHRKHSAIFGPHQSAHICKPRHQLHMYLCVSSSFLQPTFYSQVTAVIPSFPYARWSTLSSIYWHWHTIQFNQKKKYNTFNPQARQEGQISCSDIRKTRRQHALGSQPKKLHRQSYF